MELENSVVDTAPAIGCAGSSIPHYDNLMHPEQPGVAGVIRLLWRQTFMLEHKRSKRIGEFQYDRDYRVYSKHLEFIKSYFATNGVELRENGQTDIMYIQDENVVGDKLPHLTTLYLLVLKLIYDEQMKSVSTSINVCTSLHEIHEKLGDHRLFKRQPVPTDIRRAITLLKKYQAIEPLDLSEDLESESRMVAYPYVSVALIRNNVRQLPSSSGEDMDDSGVRLKAELEEEDAGDMAAKEGEPWNREQQMIAFSPSPGYV